MQGRCAIEQYRVTFRYLIQNVPNFRRLAFDHLFRAAHGMNITKIFEPADDERLEKNERHLLWQTALMKFQLGPDDNYRAT